MHLEYLLEFSVEFETAISIGEGPLGERIIADLTGGSFEGPKLKGKLRASGADWILLSPEGNLRLDVRAVLETDDGAVIYMPYRGIMVMHDKLRKVLFEHTGETGSSDGYWVTQLQFETRDERYTWLNNVMAVAEGTIAPNKASYRVYAVEAG
jgi:hypothetical protein